MDDVFIGSTGSLLSISTVESCRSMGYSGFKYMRLGGSYRFYATNDDGYIQWGLLNKT